MHNIIADLLQYGGLTCVLYGILHFTGAAMGLYDEDTEGALDANEEAS